MPTSTQSTSIQDDTKIYLEFSAHLKTSKWFNEKFTPFLKLIDRFVYEKNGQYHIDKKALIIGSVLTLVILVSSLVGSLVNHYLLKQKIIQKLSNSITTVSDVKHSKTELTILNN